MEQLQVGDKIFIVAIISENIIYVQRTNNVDVFSQIFKHSKDAVKLDMFPMVGDLALAQIDDEIYRIKVLSTPDDESQLICVHLIDYGNTAQVKFEQLLSMSPQCQAVKCATLKVILKDVNIPAINQSVIEYLCSLKSFKTELTVAEIIKNEFVLKSDEITNSVNKEILKLSQVPDASFDNYHPVIYDVS